MPDSVKFIAVPQCAFVVAASITHATAATADALTTMTRDAFRVQLLSTLNTEVIVTYNGANLCHMPSLTFVPMVFSTTDVYFANGGKFAAYCTGASPTVGVLEVTYF